jgi:cyclopropane fatty-acyl-phospholipid synthase-like methyltransferase
LGEQEPAVQPEEIEASYDRMADHYLRTKDVHDPVTLAVLGQLATGLPEGATVLDPGCGAGVPATQWLARRFTVTGVDVSTRQLQLARRHAPETILIKASMTAVDFAPATFDAVVALYSIIHVPRTTHPSLLRRIHTWLKPGGRFLATWAIHAWEGHEDNWQGWDVTMWWSHDDAETNVQMLREAGFDIDSAETRTSGNETWIWVLACAS